MLMQSRYNTYIEIQLKEQPERGENLEVGIDSTWSGTHTYQGKEGLGSATAAFPTDSVTVYMFPVISSYAT